MSGAPPYMPLFVSDYLADTTHLTTEEHGAYLMLIMRYWQQQGPLPSNPRRLAGWARVPLDRWDEVAEAVAEFFDVDGDVWRHGRIDLEIEIAAEKAKKASESGKAGAAARWRKRGAANATANGDRIATASEPQCDANSKLGTGLVVTSTSLRSVDGASAPPPADESPIAEPQFAAEPASPPDRANWDKLLFDTAEALLTGKPWPNKPDKTVTAAEARSLAGRLKRSRNGNPWEAWQAFLGAKTAADPVQYVLGALKPDNRPSGRDPPQRDWSAWN